LPRRAWRLFAQRAASCCYEHEARAKKDAEARARRSAATAARFMAHAQLVKRRATIFYAPCGRACRFEQRVVAGVACQQRMLRVCAMRHQPSARRHASAAAPLWCRRARCDTPQHSCAIAQAPAARRQPSFAAPCAPPRHLRGARRSHLRRHVARRNRPRMRSFSDARGTLFRGNARVLLTRLPKEAACVQYAASPRNDTAALPQTAAYERCCASPKGIARQMRRRAACVRCPRARVSQSAREAWRAAYSASMLPKRDDRHSGSKRYYRD